jgi:hypothetical protein
MKITLKKYLIYSSIFAIFSEAFFFNIIIDWKLFYLIIFVNSFLLFKLKKIALNLYFVLLLLFCLIHGILAYSIISIPYNFMLSQIIGIAITGAYYYNFISFYNREELIAIYLKISLFVAVIAYPLYFFNITISSTDPRLHSVFKEPAHYVIVILPACYYYFKTKSYKKFAILLGTILLSASSLGYIGIALLLILPNLTFKKLGYVFAILPVVLVAFYYTYKELPFLQLRVDDTYNSLNVINNGKFNENTNLSSYVLISNLYIAKKNINDHPLGSGIGSHHYMHTKRYLKEMRPPEYLKIQKKETDNSFDANSLFTRICSEFGVIGFLFILLVLYETSKSFQNNKMFLAQGIFIYFLLKLLRDGTYFPPELFFFVWLFYFSFKDYKNNSVIIYDKN